MNQRDQIKSAIGAHGLWKGRLRATIESGASDLAVQVVRADDQCSFGKWLLGLDAEVAKSPAYRTCRDLHAQFHIAAAGVLALAVAGKKQEALKAMETDSEFTRISRKLTVAMIEWVRTSEPLLV